MVLPGRGSLKLMAVRELGLGSEDQSGRPRWLRLSHAGRPWFHFKCGEENEGVFREENNNL